MQVAQVGQLAAVGTASAEVERLAADSTSSAGARCLAAGSTSFVGAEHLAAEALGCSGPMWSLPELWRCAARCRQPCGSLAAFSSF